MINDNELEYWQEQYPDLELEEILDLLEGVEEDWAGEGFESDGLFPQAPEEETDTMSQIVKQVFAKLNKGKSIDADD